MGGMEPNPYESPKDCQPPRHGVDDGRQANRALEALRVALFFTFIGWLLAVGPISGFAFPLIGFAAGLLLFLATTPRS